MAIILNDNVQVNLGKPVDNKYLQPTLNKPYINISEVNTTIIEALRYTGLTVNILGIEYWYATGVTDTDLVIKTTGGGDVAGVNVGGEAEVFSGATGTTSYYRTLVGSGNTTVVQSGDSIVINSEGGSIASGERIEKVINQVNDFNVGEVIGFSGTSYVRALARTDFNGEVHGIVSESGATQFTLVYAGYVNGLPLGLAINTTYFLSDVFPGQLITSSPSVIGSTIKPMLNTTTASTEGLVFQYLGFANTTGVTGGGSGVTTGATFGGGEAVFRDVSGDTMNFRSLVGTGGTVVNTIGDIIYISGGSALKNVAVSTITTYSATNNDNYIGSSGITTINLPPSPNIGLEITIADTKGDALTNSITVQGNGNNIEGSTSASINTDYGSMTVLWNGFIWSVIGFKV